MTASQNWGTSTGYSAPNRTYAVVNTTTTTMQIYNTNSTTTTSMTATPWVNTVTLPRTYPYHPKLQYDNDKITLKDDFQGDISLPDGTILRFDNGNYEILDQDAKVIYRANRFREFNRFLNASDLLEEFVKDCGQYGVRKQDFFEITVDVFINWLIVKAALHDGDPVPTAEINENRRLKRLSLPKCHHCGRFIPREWLRRGINFCSGSHLDAFLAKPKLLALPAPRSA